MPVISFIELFSRPSPLKILTAIIDTAVARPTTVTVVSVAERSLCGWLAHAGTAMNKTPPKKPAAAVIASSLLVVGIMVFDKVFDRQQERLTTPLLSQRQMQAQEDRSMCFLLT